MVAGNRSVVDVCEIEPKTQTGLWSKRSLRRIGEGVLVTVGSLVMLSKAFGSTPETWLGIWGRRSRSSESRLCQRGQPRRHGESMLTVTGLSWATARPGRLPGGCAARAAVH